MSYLVMSAALLGSAAVAARACSVVEVVDTKPSLRNAKITVLLSGKPKASVNLEVVFSGARGPRAEVQIYGQGSYRQNRVAKTLTDEEGEFAAPLAPGHYTVVFQMAGFKTAFRVIAISTDGREGQLQENLQTAPCT